MADAGLRRRSAAELIAGRLAASGLATPAADLVRAALASAWPGGLGGPDGSGGAEDSGGPDGSGGTEGSGGRGAERPGACAAGTPVYLGAIGVGGVELRLRAEPGLTVVTGAGEAGLAEAVGRVLAGDEPSRVTVRLEPEMTEGLSAALRWDRPVLARAELTALACGSPERQYDALRGVLGVGVLATAEEWLASEGLTGRSREGLDEAAGGRGDGTDLGRAALLERLRGCPDERARAAEAILEREPADLDALGRRAISDWEGGGPAGLWRQLAAARLPGAEVAERAVRRLEEARQRVGALSGTSAEDARQLAALVRAALEHVTAHPGRPCPLCRGRVLDERWVAGARRAAGRLGRLAGEADAIRGEAEAAAAALRTLVPRLPGVIEGAPVPPDAGLDFTAARAAWRRWSELAAGVGSGIPPGDGDELVEAERRFGELLAAVGELRKRAAGRLRERDETWRPVGTALAVWTETEREANREAERAEAWLRDAGQEVAGERLAELAPGTGLDGVLGGLEPGERAGLGVELFLEWAGVCGGPFGFVVVDQPAEADAGRVARALEQAAGRVQVIVAASDDELAAALGNAATVVELPG
jgi:hypothetical protein